MPYKLPEERLICSKWPSQKGPPFVIYMPGGVPFSKAHEVLFVWMALPGRSREAHRQSPGLSNVELKSGSGSQGCWRSQDPIHTLHAMCGGLAPLLGLQGR